MEPGKRPGRAAQAGHGIRRAIGGQIGERLVRIAWKRDHKTGAKAPLTLRFRPSPVLLDRLCLLTPKGASTHSLRKILNNSYVFVNMVGRFCLSAPGRKKAESHQWVESAHWPRLRAGRKINL
jgi:hypothetical protein